MPHTADTVYNSQNLPQLLHNPAMIGVTGPAWKNVILAATSVSSLIAILPPASWGMIGYLPDCLSFGWSILHDPRMVLRRVASSDCSRKTDL